MLFNSFVFLIYLPIVLGLYYLLPKNYKKITLLISSYIFYGYWDYRFLSLLLLSTVIDYFLGLSIYNSNDQHKKKLFLILSMVSNLSILGVFKYFNFFVNSFNELIKPLGGSLDYVHLYIVLPVGISFYTFQTMSYTIDVYRKKMQPTHSFIDFAVFVSFFPQLVAGPIERASNLLPQFKTPPKATMVQIEKGITLIVLGLFKKVMLGDVTGRIVDNIFAQPSLYKSSELIAGLILFSIQIYADFSGYSNIARGTAKLFGVELMKNFEQPYLSSNITEFWRRWHISLSSWLKDYLYISLGGNRKGEKRTYINLMLTMLLGGLWHGASWNFVIWGGLHGIYLAFHKMMLGKKKIQERFEYTDFKSLLIFITKVFFTFILVLITWLFFRATDFNTIQIFVSKMIHWESSEFTWRFVKITSAFFSVMLIYDIFEYYLRKHTFVLAIKEKAFAYGILSAMFIVTCVFLFQSKPLPFVYFQF